MACLNCSGSLRVGKVSFINTLPIFYPLESGVVAHDFQIIDGTPADLNVMLAANELDLGLVSSIEYARRFERYFLLPDLSISCRNRVFSVLLLSRVPLQELEGEEVLLTPKSHTSIALLKLLFSQRFAVQPSYRLADYHCSTARWPDGAAAILAIGDDALRWRKSAEVKLALDLGAAWYEWTGLPFVFAVWASRRETLSRSDGLIHHAHATLLEAREYGLNHLESIAGSIGPCPWLSRGECLHYLQTIEYDLDADKKEGLTLFFDMLYDAGELGRRAPLCFLPGSSRAASQAGSGTR